MEKSEIPIAVYQFVDGYIKTVLVSEGLVRWLPPGCTRENLISLLDTDMYRDVHREDVVLVATKAKEFAKAKNCHYDVVYRQKLYGKEEFRTLHAVGYHDQFDDGNDYVVVVYDDVTAALESNRGNRLIFDDSLVEYLNTDKVNPYVILDAKTHEIYMVSASVERILKPVKAFDSGILFEEYFFNAGESSLITVDDILEKGEAIVQNPRTGKDLILSATLMRWHGKNSVLLRVSEHADRYFDSLTGLPNMEYSRVCGENFADKIRNAGGEPAIIFFDIVGMKLYNSANGFNMGNEFLINFAASLKKQFPKNLIWRFSNDHFAVIADVRNVEDKLNEIRRNVKGFISKISMDLYVGICKIDEFDAILDTSEKAKLACHEQKKNGDTFIRYYDDDLRKALLLQNYVVNHIDEAIAKGYIKVYYQPVVRTITETFCGMEALARWIDPQYGFLNPAVFIGALEESRQIHKLDSHIVELVCKEMREELDQGHPVVPVSFNLSRLDFIGCDIFDVVEKALQKYNIEREYIRVEITESIMASDSYVQSEIQRFRLVGYEVWMDDFGSGYSSLNTLKDYKFDELKIDMAFLSNFNDASRTIIRSTVRMAKNLGLKTLAEGVETKEQMDFLKGIGCEKVQGYYYGKPQPLKDTMEHMKSIGMLIEDSDIRVVYSKLGRLDYLVDSPKGILEYKNGLFKFLFVNKQLEEQVLSIGFANIEDVENSINDPKDPAYYTLHEAEKAAYKAPKEMTYAAHGTYVFLSGSLIADINGSHIYDMSLRNTHVSAFDSSVVDSKASLPTETKTILLADVNPQNRAFLESVLRKDYNLLLAEDGEQVLNILLEYGNRISLVLIDADLPKIDGFKIIQKFQCDRRDLQIPFIIMTDNMELAKESIRLGAYQFIHTPIKDQGLIKAKIDGSIKNAEFLHQVALNYMEYVPGGIIVFDASNADILYVNARVLDIFECDSVDEFREFIGVDFKNTILPEDYAKTDRELKEQVRSGSTATKQVTYRAKTAKGRVKRIYHVGKVFKDTPYGSVFSAFISEDDMAMKSYFTRRDAFNEFMASGEATHTKSYEPGYKGFLFWNLTKNSPVIRMDGISYIPKELEGKYTYETHYSFLSTLMLKDNTLKASDYTREKLILDFMNKCIVPPLDVTYDIDNILFTIRSSFDMIMDPDSGDIILKLQNENVETSKKVEK
ncbi:MULTISPECIES: EAL domain-containing protein [unclassified Fibrobacter]|uniref:EAL domain-containing protein n=1 Tax=unclassified Fibrobacter TaxID=2634177 RepID=UPI0020C87634|nr:MULTISPECIES: EAL domain-containing protein [unclassified Fibrobacter]